ncbi:hypothetical protein V1478_011511 [Vespula squamosa]|uniref:Uncharacterized protein n=1 Tax=Vespula squamosa TaxID=30214 RepID=A0ABD2AFM2_VESSQ
MVVAWNGREYNGDDIKKKKKRKTSYNIRVFFFFFLWGRKSKGTFTFTIRLSNYLRTYIQFILPVAARKFRWFRGNKHTNVVFKVESHDDDDDKDDDDDDDDDEEEEDLRPLLLVSSMEYNDDTCKEMG